MLKLQHHLVCTRASIIAINHAHMAELIHTIDAIESKHGNSQFIWFMKQKLTELDKQDNVVYCAERNEFIDDIHTSDDDDILNNEREKESKSITYSRKAMIDIWITERIAKEHTHISDLYEEFRAKFNSDETKNTFSGHVKGLGNLVITCKEHKQPTWKKFKTSIY